ncbi:MAG: phosphoribosylformylglycinamidine synthase subunit PurL [Patescibacteria group bacterium]
MLKIESIPKILSEAIGSEHTSYASTKKFLTKLPTKGRYVIQGPGENAGIVDLGGEWALAIRIESHNHPSFINPYQGAATGVGGILRDIFTMGARPIALLDFLRFGTNKKAQRLLEGVVRGIADYGNCVGVPTVGGDIYFDKSYDYNCLVNVAALGLVKKKNIIYGNALTAGADLIYVGARTGRDGIGGSQMASVNLDKLEHKAIQDSDPFLEKLLLDACGELAGTGWVEGMQDMGAAGLLCSTSEVAIRGRKKTGKNLGTKVYLNRVPTKASGMNPVELLLSESQERMLIVGKRKYREQILKLFKHWDLEAVVIGIVTNDGKYTLVFDDFSSSRNGATKTLSMDFDSVFKDFRKDWEIIPWKKQGTKHIDAPYKIKKNTWQQYDWMVGTRTLKGPNKKGHFSILDIPEVNKELVISWSSDEGRSDVDPRKGVEFAFDKCFATLKKQKATPLGLTNCLNFGHPAQSIGAFSQTIEGLSERCEKFKVTVVSGNVSLYNAHKGVSIKPTPVIVMVGIRSRIFKGVPRV